MPTLLLTNRQAAKDVKPVSTTKIVKYDWE